MIKRLFIIFAILFAVSSIAYTEGQSTSEKLMESVSVKDFGALGNGTTNDTPAMQKAFAYIAAKGGTLLIPPGTYLQGAGTNGADASFTFTAANNIRIIGYGATITAATTLIADKGFYFLNCNNITIEGLKYDGRLDERTFNLTTHASSNGFGFRGCNQVTLRNLTAYRCMMDGIHIGKATTSDGGLGCSNITIDNCISTYNCRQGMSLVGASYVNVIGGSYSYTGEYGALKQTPPMAGIDIEANDSYTKNASNCAITVESNSASDAGKTLTVYGTTYGTNDVTQEVITVGSLSAVTSSKTNWGQIRNLVMSAACSGTVTIKRASDSVTMTTLSVGSLGKEIYVYNRGINIRGALFQNNELGVVLTKGAQAVSVEACHILNNHDVGILVGSTSIGCSVRSCRIKADTTVDLYSPAQMLLAEGLRELRKRVLVNVQGEYFSFTDNHVLAGGNHHGLWSSSISYDAQCHNNIIEDINKPGVDTAKNLVLIRGVRPRFCNNSVKNAAGTGASQYGVRVESSSAIVKDNIITSIHGNAGAWGMLITSAAIVAGNYVSGHKTTSGNKEIHIALAATLSPVSGKVASRLDFYKDNFDGQNAANGRSSASSTYPL